MASLDKTSAEYWSDLWSASDLPPAIDLRSTTYLTRKYHQVFAELLSPGGADIYLEPADAIPGIFLTHHTLLRR